MLKNMMTENISLKKLCGLQVDIIKPLLKVDRKDAVLKFMTSINFICCPIGG